MPLVKKFIDLILYSNIFIAVAAVCMTWLSQFLIGVPYGLNPITILVFCATLVIYALHRLVGLPKAKDFQENERYRVIKKYRIHIGIYAVLGLIGGAISFFMVTNAVRWAIVIPAIFSLAYVLPVLGSKQKFRLRDISFVKIFFVALVWAYVTVLLPVLEAGMPISWNQLGFMFIERSCFVFAITLPFDIRDLEFDRHHKVQTIPAKIGLPKTLNLALFLIIVFMLINGVLYAGNPTRIAGFLISGISTYLFIHFVANKKHDYYFTGLIDGTMILQFLFVYLVFLLN